MNRKPTALVVDDDTQILSLLSDILEPQGFRVLTATRARHALELLDKETVDIALLDLSLPDMDGYALCARVREFSAVPIMMVTAKDAETDIVTGLEAGADDFMSKPFFTSELSARVHALLRRSTQSDQSTEPPFRCNGLVVDLAAHQVNLGGAEIELTRTERKLLSYLARNAGRVVTMDTILERVWGKEYRGETHLLQVTVSRLRQKLGDDAKNPRYIVTTPGIGYKLVNDL